MTLQRVPTTDAELSRVQDNVEAEFKRVSVTPFQGGTFLASVSLSGGASNVIAHKLRRQPQAWTLCDLNANTAVYRQAWDSDTITLTCGASCTISLWVS